MRDISTRVNRPLQRRGAQPAQIIEGQWRVAGTPAKTNSVTIPKVAWFVVSSFGIFMAVFASVVTGHIAIDSAIWFTGGMVVGGLLSSVAVALFSYLVYSVNRQS